jgi:[NiFe] hydrogenase diaphorase moiety large subunit
MTWRAIPLRGCVPEGLAMPTDTTIADLVTRHGAERTALPGILQELQGLEGRVSPGRQREVAEALGLRPVDVRAFVTFYSFLTEDPQWTTVIRLSDDVVDEMKGMPRVRQAFEEALGIGVGETTDDGTVTLTDTPCIGLSDQAPAALVGTVPVTELTPDRARDVVQGLREHGDPQRLVTRLGDGRNADPRIRAMVNNNLRRPGPFVFGRENRGAALGKALSLRPREVVRTIEAADLRGRGGAGFPTAMKWELTRVAGSGRKFVVCNADEGEPGTFKDRVILTEFPDRVIEGMTLGAYAVGAREGLLYLRGEYAYLRRYLESVLQRRRDDGLLGRDILGRRGFDFDIRIVLGAGSYLCGEETALLNSCEGRPGDARHRPPFPTEAGFLGLPTTVNNVETFCCATKILELGATAFTAEGIPGSTGTKALSVCGDCTRPGVYEVPFGIPLAEVLEMSGATGSAAVLVGGPAGTLVGPDAFRRRIACEDLPTGGAVVCFGAERDLVEVIARYADFFAEESCGYCTPCREGTQLVRRYLARIRNGRADREDLDGLLRVAWTMKAASRCGLGQTAANPVLTGHRHFPDLFRERLATEDRRRAAFALDEAVSSARQLRRRHDGGPHA